MTTLVLLILNAILTVVAFVIFGWKAALGIIVLAGVIYALGAWLRMFTGMLFMFTGILIVGLIVGYVKYQGFQGFMAMKAGMASAKQIVSTTKATTQDWREQLEAVGSLRAVKGVDISNELAGIVEDIRFNSGDDVKEGTLLIKLRAEDDIAKLQSLQAAAKLASITLERDKKQLRVQAVSQATVDTDVATYAGAVALAAQQQALVDKKLIRAPFSGHLGIRNVDIGQYLNAGTAIVTLQQLDPIYLDFNVPQQSLAQIEAGQKISIKNDTYPGQKFEGIIAAINPKVDTTTRNVQVRAQLPNADRKLLPGMYATADIEVGESKQFVTLPQTAITYNPYGDTIYIVRHQDEIKTPETDASAKKEEPKEAPKEPAETPKEVAHKPIGDKDDDLAVEQVFVTVGETRGDQVQILKGVKDGDTVVGSGQLKLQNGSAITVNNTVTPKNDPNPHPLDQ